MSPTTSDRVGMAIAWALGLTVLIVLVAVSL